MHDNAQINNGKPQTVQRMPKILFNITHGFQARMLLRSQISETLLARGAELIVVSPNADEEYFRREFDHPQIRLEKMPSKFSRVETLLINLRQYLLMNPSLGATLNHKNEEFRRRSPKFYWFTRAANLVLGRVPLLRRAYLAMENRLYPGREFDELLDRHRPDLVVTGTPGFMADDIHLLRAARRAGIPTATVMLSWDNLTSKGYMGARPDHLLVWSDLMADEAVRYHDFPRERIEWCGAAQFDHYHGLRERFDRAAWRRKQGLAPGKPVILYGTVNPGVIPHELSIVQAIVGAVRAGKFTSRPHLWIRMHPQAVRGYYAANVDAYRELAGDDVTVEVPPVRSDKLAWDLPPEDAMHLAELLAAADVVATPGSTLVIDAACVDTATIGVAFDGDVELAAEYRTSRFLDYTHYVKLLGTGAVSIAHSVDDFVRMVDEHVANPSAHVAGCRAIVRQQFNRADGQAGRRTADALLALAGCMTDEGFAASPDMPERVAV